jgi:hypothetical protein
MLVSPAVVVKFLLPLVMFVLPLVTVRPVGFAFHVIRTSCALPLSLGLRLLGV